MQYSVVITDSVLRNCELEIEAEDENEAYEKAREMWRDGELEDCMDTNDPEPYLEEISIIDCE